MKMNNTKCKKVIIIAGKLLFVAVVFLFFSVRYYMKCWDVDFATALYQMSSPLKGTNPQYFLQYIEVAAVPMVCSLMGWYFFWKILLFLIGNRIPFVKLYVRSRKFAFKFGRNRCLWLKRGLMVCFSAVAIIYIAIAADQIGMTEFLNSYTHATTLFEDYYVPPQDVKIVFPEEKKNLLLIYLESMETTYMSTEVGGGKEIDYIPELTDLAEANISFSDSDKLGGAVNGHLTGWTMAALLSSSCGIPFKLPIGGNDVESYTDFLPGVIGLGDVLQQNGYTNYFLCGSEATFAGRDVFYQQHGNYQIYDYTYAVENGKEDPAEKTYWGFNDRKLFQYAKEYLTDIAQKEEPFNFIMLTVDTHHPEGYLCELCEDQYDEQYANVLSCSSRQVDEFMNWVIEQSWYEDTVVVLIGDHLSMNTSFWDDIGDYERSIYNCFVNTDRTCSDEVMKNRVFCSMDFFPTILSAMSVDIEGNRLGLGVDLFSGEQTLYEKFGRTEMDKLLAGYSKYYMEYFVGD